MDRIPLLWAAAYGSRRPRLIRILALGALRVIVLVQILAVTDRDMFVSL